MAFVVSEQRYAKRERRRRDESISKRNRSALCVGSNRQLSISYAESHTVRNDSKLA